MYTTRVVNLFSILLLALFVIFLGVFVFVWIKLQKVINEKNELDKSDVKKSSEIQFKQETITNYENKIKELLQEKQEKDAVITELSKENSKLNERLNSKEESIKSMEDYDKRFQEYFKLLSNTVLKEQSDSFGKKQKESLDIVLEPLKKDLKEYKEKIDSFNANGLKNREFIETSFKNFSNLTIDLKTQTKNLEDAIKGNVKAQGNWGEVVLIRLLQLSGLQEKLDYDKQSYAAGDDGGRFADVVVKIPSGDKEVNIIIDSKVAGMQSYINYFESGEENEETRAKFLESLVKSIRKHINDLSGKDYPNIVKGENVPFVIMFVPIDIAFSEILKIDHNIYEEALSKNVIIATTWNLLAMIKSIKYMIDLKKQSENSNEIARLGGRLYDKFHGFLSDFENIGKKLKDSQKSYEGALNKLSTGQGNAISIAKKMEELGIRTNSKNKKGLKKTELLNQNSIHDNLEDETELDLLEDVQIQDSTS